MSEQALSGALEAGRERCSTAARSKGITTYGASTRGAINSGGA